VKPGDKLTLKVDQFTKNIQPKVVDLLAENPDAAVAEWTGDVHKPLRWQRDGEVYSPTGLVNALLAEVGIAVKTIPGPDYWLLPSGRSMYEESKLVEQ
jgi:hypothetical protein